MWVVSEVHEAYGIECIRPTEEVRVRSSQETEGDLHRVIIYTLWKMNLYERARPK